MSIYFNLGEQWSNRHNLWMILITWSRMNQLIDGGFELNCLIEYLNCTDLQCGSEAKVSLCACMIV